MFQPFKYKPVWTWGHFSKGVSFSIRYSMKQLPIGLFLQIMRQINPQLKGQMSYVFVEN